MGKITTTLECKNIAPINHLYKKIESDNIRMAIFADNGAGKTYLSNAFRLLEQTDESFVDKKGNIKTDKFITFSNNESNFSFCIKTKII